MPKMEKTLGEALKQFTIEQIKIQLQQYFYWQLEQEENMLAGYFYSLQPNLFMVDRIHKIIELNTQLDDNSLNWKDIVEEAKEKAKQQRLEEAEKEKNEQ